MSPRICSSWLSKIGCSCLSWNRGGINLKASMKKGISWSPRTMKFRAKFCSTKSSCQRNSSKFANRGKPRNNPSWIAAPTRLPVRTLRPEFCSYKTNWRAGSSSARSWNRITTRRFPCWKLTWKIVSSPKTMKRKWKTLQWEDKTPTWALRRSKTQNAPSQCARSRSTSRYLKKRERIWIGCSKKRTSLNKKWSDWVSNTSTWP